MDKTQVLCDDCLKVIMYKLSKEDMLILNHLKKMKSFNQHLALDKVRLMTDVKGLTDFKINMCFNRLEVTGLINRVALGRASKYFISTDGLKLIELYSKDVLGAMKGEK